MLQRRYEELISKSRLRPDAEQLRCLRRFQQLLDELQAYTPSVAEYELDNTRYQVSGTPFGSAKTKTFLLKVLLGVSLV